MTSSAVEKVCAVFIFNHRFEGNLSKLDSLYGERFPNRYYLMPFSRTPSARVVSVNESSWRFAGHIAQGAQQFVSGEYSHYAFIADDLLMNPKINAGNLVEMLSLLPGQGYIKSLASCDSLRYQWPWAGESAMSMRKFGRGFDYSSELPSPGDAQRKFELMGLRFPFPFPRSLRQLWYAVFVLFKQSPWAFFMGLGMTGRRCDYPLICGYSDFVVVPASGIADFCHYCGVFSAMNIFAEVAVPTALGLACDDVRTELPIGSHFIGFDDSRAWRGGLKGREIWSPGEVAEFDSSFTEKTLGALVREFPPDALYVHPVKLSGWRS